MQSGRNGKKLFIILGFFVLLAAAFAALSSQASAAPTPQINLPDIQIGSSNAKTPEEMALPIQILFMMTILSMAPYILVMTTAFIRVTIVLSFLRTAMGTQQVPPTQVLMGLSLFITFYIMMPVGKDINEQAIKPYTSKQISWNQFLDKASSPMRGFMLRQTNKKELDLFLKMSRIQKKIEKKEDVPIWVVIPAFVLSEIKTAFSIGFLIYLPFLVVDMVVSCILMAMGMFMLSPMTISTPFKLLMFVLVDGWDLVVESLLKSFR